MDGNATSARVTGESHVIATPTGPLLGAEISGVDLKAPLSQAQVSAIRAALLKHKVLFFRDQETKRGSCWRTCSIG